MKRCEEAKQWHWIATLLYNAFENPAESSDELRQQAIQLYEQYDSPEDGEETE